MPASSELLDRLLDPVGRALTPDVARRLIAIRADDATQQRIDALAERNNEGLLSEEERSEYEALVSAADLITLLQAKARAVLAGNSAT
jgi:hypothetical protein